jgi:hypothetical protein
MQSILLVQIGFTLNEGPWAIAHVFSHGLLQKWGTVRFYRWWPKPSSVNSHFVQFAYERSTRDRVFEVNWHRTYYKHYLNQVSYHQGWRQIYSNSAKILKATNSFQ